MYQRSFISFKAQLILQPFFPPSGMIQFLIASFQIFIASKIVLESNQSASFSAFVIPKTEQAHSEP
nr:MAG TPA: hypothetical protein [Caudoviricetes sp.]